MCIVIIIFQNNWILQKNVSARVRYLIATLLLLKSQLLLFSGPNEILDEVTLESHFRLIEEFGELTTFK